MERRKVLSASAVGGRALDRRHADARRAGGLSALPHAVSLISTLAAGFGLALLFGFVAARLGLPALIGYLIAGIVIGPATPGFVADAEIAAQLAEIGVMLLMFGVGLHFSLDDLLAVRKVALPGAVVQMGVATALGAAVARFWGWSLGAALVFGLTLSVASTVVLLKALEGRGELESGDGRIAIGWLSSRTWRWCWCWWSCRRSPASSAAAAAPAAAAATAASLGLDPGQTFAEVAVFVALMLVVGRRAFPWLLWQVTKTGSRELFTLAVIVAAVTIAYGSALLFGVSFALGAFFAGMVLRESSFSHRAAEETLPLRDAFAVLFFVSVGMLFDPAVLFEQPLRVLGGGRDHRRRQVGRGGGARAGVRLSAAHRPHGLAPAWRRSASSRSSSAPSASRSACCPAKGAAWSSPGP